MLQEETNKDEIENLTYDVNIQLAENEDVDSQELLLTEDCEKEVLSDGVIENIEEPWIGELQLSQISDFGRNAVSNYIFMKKLLKISMERE